MLPHAYALPAAVLIGVGGVLACFAGYRLFRIVLAVYGFILGAMIASSVMGVSNTAGMLVAALLGGLVGAIVLVFAYFVGIAIVGAGSAALVAHLAWHQIYAHDPPALAIVIASVVGGLAAMVLQRYVIVVATAVGGAWTMIVGVLAAVSARVAEAPATNATVWILYPLHPASGERWVSVAWAALSLFGIAVQLGVTARRKP
jgi:hypothetical protein